MHTARVLGFVGRRNLTKTDDDYAGPKYLNAKTTPAFAKGQRNPRRLHNHPGQPRRRRRARPVGTALTTDQINILRRHLPLANGREHTAVATDGDPAGWTATQPAFWNLTAADLDPTHLALPRGLDPASLLQAEGPDAIRAAINERLPLGDVMLDQLLRTAGSRSDSEVRQYIVDHAARILVAQGPDDLADGFARLNRWLHLSTGILEHHTLAEGINRDHDPAGYTAARVAELTALTVPRVTTGPRRLPRSSTTPALRASTPSCRWRRDYFGRHSR